MAKIIKKIGKAKPAAVEPDEDNSEMAEAVTVTITKMYADGELNTDESEVLEVKRFPSGVGISKVAVMLGASKPYGEVKGSVTVSVPTTIEEIDDAFEYAAGKAQAYLEQIAEATAEADEPEPEETKPAAKKAAAKPAGKKPAPEPEDEAEEEAEDGDGLGEEDIRAMNRKQLESFIKEYSEGADDLDSLTMSDYPVNPKGLEKLKNSVVEILFAEEDAPEEEAEEAAEEGAEADDPNLYTQKELQVMEEDDLKGIYKEWEMGAYPKGKTSRERRTAAIAAILEFQEE